MEYWHNKYCDIAIESDIGERSENQDAFGVSISEKKAVVTVCDGMGGFEGGMAASRLAADEMLRLCDISDDKSGNYSKVLTYAMDSADIKISNMHNDKGRKMHAGSTCVTVILNKREMYCLSVGDSRLYLYRKGKIAQLTRDHTIALMADNDYRKGLITYEEYMNMLDDNKTLCSYLGLGGIDIYDVNEDVYPLQKDDILVISSDGLYKSLNIDQIKEITETYSDTKKIVNNLITAAAAHAKGHNQDNTTVAVCKIK